MRLFVAPCGHSVPLTLHVVDLRAALITTSSASSSDSYPILMYLILFLCWLRTAPARKDESMTLILTPALMRTADKTSEVFPLSLTQTATIWARATTHQWKLPLQKKKLVVLFAALSDHMFCCTQPPIVTRTQNSHKCFFR